MLDIDRILKSDRLLRAMTGLNRKAFDELLPSFSQAFETATQSSSNRRQRLPGAGRKANIPTLRDKLFFILLYFKAYPTFDVLGILFDFDKSRANRWVHRLQPILEAALGKEQVLPKRQITSVNEFIASFPGVKRVIIDGIERPIQRPQDSTRQKRTYSGKKKRNTRKQIGASDQDKCILVLTPAEDGKFHDKCLLDASILVENIPKDIPIQGDLGLKGLEEEYDNIEIPHKKPKGGKLTDEQKAQNRELSQERVVVEHAFGGTKRYGVAANIYRNRKKDFDDHLMLTSAGLWNFYLKAA